MDTPHKTFADFEHDGWEDERIVAGYDDNLSVVTMQSVGALLDDAGVNAGSRMLDVASGAGYATQAAAARGADAIGIDFSLAQVRLARRRHSDLHFEQADAQSLPFADGGFDAVVSAFGICHLPDPQMALREAWRVLKPGGRLAFSVWDVPERAVGIGAVYAAIRAHGSVDVGLPEGPDFFLFSDPARSIRALQLARFVSAAVRTVRQVWRIDDPDSLYDRLAGSSVRAGTLLRSQTTVAIAAIRTQLRDSLSAYRRGAVYEVPMPAIIAAGLKPAARGD